jgi:RNA polymerase sigma factor (sigma-70 family)
MEIVFKSVRILDITSRFMLTDPLLQNMDAFIGFVRSRTGDPELAADLVQECLLKALRADKVPEDAEGVVTWFYRILRNAIIDAHRRSNTREVALEKLLHELPESPEKEDEKSICQCVMKLLPEMSEGDAELLRRIDLEGGSATAIATATNERVNTLNVRLLRARRRLREQVERVCRSCATHGCLDCDCA